jgi:protein CpxP
MKRTLAPFLAALVGAIAIPVLMLPTGAYAQATSSAPASQGATSATEIPALPKTMSEKVEQHIMQLHGQLQITSSEEPLWHQFAQVMRDNAAQMEQALDQRGAKVGSMSATASMQSYAQLAQLHATNMQKLASTFQSLYTSFPDAQKKIADTVFQNEPHRPVPPKP